MKSLTLANISNEFYSMSMEQFEARVELTEKELEQIIFLSFMFSQGNVDAQSKICRAMSLIIGTYDSEVVDNAFKGFVKKLKPDNAKKATLVSAKVHADDEEINKKQFNHDSGIWAFDSEKIDADLIPETEDVVRQFWLGDYEYLCKKGGRPNRKVDFAPNTIQDPFFSFGVHYLERGNTTGNKYFDELLSKLQEAPIGNVSIRTEVIKKYNETHPDTPLETNEQGNTSQT